MTQGLSLLGFVLNLVEDPVARQQFEADPEQVLRAHGFDELSAHDMVDAMPLVTDTVQASYEPTSASGTAGQPLAPAPGETPLAAAARHISHITATYGTDAGQTATGTENVWGNGDVPDSFDLASPHQAAPVTGFGSGAAGHAEAFAFGAGHSAAPAAAPDPVALHGAEISYNATELPGTVDHHTTIVDADHPVDHVHTDWFHDPHGFDGPHS